MSFYHTDSGKFYELTHARREIALTSINSGGLQELAGC